MATATRTGGKPQSASRQAPRKTAPKKEDDKKTLRKRVFLYLLAIILMLSAFYAYQFFQMSQIRASLDQQITDAERTNSLDHLSLKDTLGQIKKQYPNADKFSADPAFGKAPLAGRFELRTSQILDEGETGIKELRERTPFMFITDVIMPGAQKSTDDHYRESLRAHITSKDFVDFNRTKLRVDDLMSGVRFCRGEKTDLYYGYTDPVPDKATADARAKAIQGAAKRHLCP